MERRRAFVIFNPASGRGDGARRLSTYLELLERHLPEVRCAETLGPGDECRLADEALSSDVDLVVAVGGDGTWGNVADRVVRSGRDDVALGLLAAGTGNDFGRNFALERRSPEEAVRILAEGTVRRVDVGRVLTPAHPHGRDAEGPVIGRHFLNLIGFGFDVAVIEATWGARFLRGELLYKVTSLQQLFGYRGVHLRLAPTDEPVVEGDHLMLTISNGPFFGGSFPIAPAADIADGLLDAVAIADASPLTRMKLFGAAAKGQHVLSPHVHTRRSHEFRVRFAEPPRFELDGDVWVAHTNEVVIEAVQGALPVVCPH
ncbi:MAG: diacylglycerol kinase family lipid kinase [Gemmatimonadetes bacterium]|nr:MAG: diacylglycerol kinase family lipid kinase [Gemmatimonadota bacterium]